MLLIVKLIDDIDKVELCKKFMSHALIKNEMLTEDLEKYDSSYKGKTFLILAIERNNNAIVKYLLEEKKVEDSIAKKYSFVRSEKFPAAGMVVLAGVQGEYKEKVKFILENCTKSDKRKIVEFKPKTQLGEKMVSCTILGVAVAKKNKKKEDLIREKGKDERSWVLTEEEKEELLASQKDKESIIESLLKFGLEPNVVVYNEWTPLLLAINSLEEGVVKLLLNYGAKPHYFPNTGLTPLLMAVRAHNAPIVKLLLEYGADPKFIPPQCGEKKNLMPPLVEAVMRSQKDIVQLLIDHGADPRYIIVNGNSLVSIAEKIGNKDIIASLRSVEDRSILLSEEEAKTHKKCMNRQ